MTFRPATPDDAPALAALHARSFDPPWSARDIAELLSAPGGLGLMIERQDAVAGFVLVRLILEEAEILTLAVDPDLRRAGLGRLLTDAAAAASVSGGAQALFLEVAVDNVAARALYAASGFERAGFRPGYYRRPGADPVDALVLRRDLTL